MVMEIRSGIFTQGRSAGIVIMKLMSVVYSPVAVLDGKVLLLLAESAVLTLLILVFSVLQEAHWDKRFVKHIVMAVHKNQEPRHADK
jgi:hypothetical protein